MTDADRQRLAAILGMLGSDHQGERDAAALQAEVFRRKHGLTWAELINGKTVYLGGAPPWQRETPPPPRPAERPTWTPPPQPKPEPFVYAPWTPPELTPRSAARTHIGLSKRGDLISFGCMTVGATVILFALRYFLIYLGY